jgi:hypothetical protein
MRERRRMSYLVGILSLSLAITGLYGGTAFAGGENNKNAHWTQKHIRKVPPIMMYEPYFIEMFGQTDRDVPYNYEEAVKLAGHSCGATSSAWEIAKKALEILYPDETPVRGNIMVYAPGAEDEWNIGVIGEVITYITGAAPHTGFSGAEFANGWPSPPNTQSSGDPVYKRRNKMVYTEEAVGTWPPNGMIWKFVRLDNDEQVCVRFNYVGSAGIFPPASPDWVVLGARIASGDETLTAEEIESYISWWNVRTEYVFENSDDLVVVLTGCPDPFPPVPPVPAE